MSQASIKLPSLSEMIPVERIILDVQAKDWRDAVRIAGELLLQSQYITSGYIQAMIETAEELKQYIVVAPGIALPHARPDAGAIKTGMSLVRLSPPIDFGNPDHDPVSLVFALAAVDKRFHVRAMKALAELFMSSDLVAQLKSAGSLNEVTAVFKKAEVIE